MGKLLTQGFNFEDWLTLNRQCSIGHQLLFVNGNPRLYRFELFGGQVPFNQFAFGNADNRLSQAVA